MRISRWALSPLVLVWLGMVGGCGGGGGTGADAPQQPGTAPLRWTQVTEKTTCEATEPDACVGYYGFTITAEGKYVAGPDPQGRTHTGLLTEEEADRIRADASALASQNLSVPASCEPAVSIPGVSARIDLTLSDGSVATVYDSRGAGGKLCLLGGVENVRKLQEDLHPLLEKYYPSPF